MKLAIVGSRSITDEEIVRRAIDTSPWSPDSSIKFWYKYIEFVSGGADGVDTCAESIADEYDIPIEIVEPDYSDWSGDEHPAKRRNTQIVEVSDVVIAVWDGTSNGTRNTIDKALDRGTPVCVEVSDGTS